MAGRWATGGCSGEGVRHSRPDGSTSCVVHLEHRADAKKKKKKTGGWRWLLGREGEKRGEEEREIKASRSGVWAGGGLEIVIRLRRTSSRTGTGRWVSRRAGGAGWRADASPLTWV